MKLELLDNLVKSLKTLPGVGEKTALRHAFYLLGHNPETALELANNIKTAVLGIKPCPQCNLLADTQPCYICNDQTRDNNQLCVVESSHDVFLLEQNSIFKGRYFVLGHLLSPMDGIGPEQIKAEKLTQMVSQLQPKEIILALNPSTEGETTIAYLADLLANSGATITRLSTGLPFGGDIGYTSAPTLVNAFARRYNA